MTHVLSDARFRPLFCVKRSVANSYNNLTFEKEEICGSFSQLV